MSPVTGRAGPMFWQELLRRVKMMWVPMNAVRMEIKAAFTRVGPCLCAMNLFESDPIRGCACLLLPKFFITLAIIHWVL
jgi:hypothetical protein